MRLGGWSSSLFSSTPSSSSAVPPQRDRSSSSPVRTSTKKERTNHNVPKNIEDVHHKEETDIGKEHQQDHGNTKSALESAFSFRRFSSSVTSSSIPSNDDNSSADYRKRSSIGSSLYAFGKQIKATASQVQTQLESSLQRVQKPKMKSPFLRRKRSTKASTYINSLTDEEIQRDIENIRDRLGDPWALWIQDSEKQRYRVYEVNQDHILKIKQLNTQTAKTLCRAKEAKDGLQLFHRILKPTILSSSTDESSSSVIDSTGSIDNTDTNSNNTMNDNDNNNNNTTSNPNPITSTHSTFVNVKSHYLDAIEKDIVHQTTEIKDLCTHLEALNTLVEETEVLLQNARYIKREERMYRERNELKFKLETDILVFKKRTQRANQLHLEEEEVNVIVKDEKSNDDNTTTVTHENNDDNDNTST